MTMRYWHHGPRGGMPWVWPGITFLLFGLLLVVLLAVLWRVAGQHRTTGGAPAPRWGSAPPAARHAEAERLLGERLARGEIEVEEYRRRLAALRGEPGEERSAGEGPG
ncbi:SHOCT domain-containing protein [Kitasatospora cineracea]|uniref:SHOCT domain-containing protein n=1 Tax=Kitasatospora cineracea TaxID=88074 RepID=UPI003447DBD7